MRWNVDANTNSLRKYDVKPFMIQVNPGKIDVNSRKVDINQNDVVFEKNELLFLDQTKFLAGKK